MKRRPDQATEQARARMSANITRGGGGSMPRLRANPATAALRLPQLPDQSIRAALTATAPNR